MSTPPLYQRPAEILQHLIRFDTTNPPGNERPCIEYINGLLKEAGIETTLVANHPDRPNLIARLKGRGEAPPLLLYGHVDVVTTEGQQWTHPPFEGRIVDGYVWGRGALDMKSGVAMYLAAVLKAKAENLPLPGDVIFAALADEEAGDVYGARFLVEKHSRLFEGVRYALGEFGGFNLSIGDKRFYPIMIAEKQVCWMKATFRGQAGHGSMPVHGQAMAKLGRALRLLDEHSLPVRITSPVRLMFETLARHLGGVTGLVIRLMLNPALTNPILKLLGERGKLFAPLLRNTVSPTMLKASEKVNVIPAEVTLGMDGRLVPGAKPEDMLRELYALLGDDLNIEVVKHEPGPATIDMGLFDTLGSILRSLDPAGIPLPYVLAGVTDARFFAQLGIQTYGFTPLRLPEDFNFVASVHAADERVPVEALDFGMQAVTQAIQRFHG
ncbi:MAG: M20/M25/M40 family metallo-hydrolase [Anaerolineales bacterium]|nr:M20/M25/M40 family metallo-hydrolase [Anaerolineales bacterium]MDW8226994.1 M20/M25/M40 family metallo-hydrolase [Anaerolineales bacterium]